MENRICISQILSLNKEGSNRLDNMIGAFELVNKRKNQAGHQLTKNINTLNYQKSQR